MRVMMCLAFAVAACGASPKPAPPPPVPAPQLATEEQLDALEKRLCECTDEVCRREVIDDMKGAATDLVRAGDWYMHVGNCQRSNQAIGELTALRERACACEDTTCAAGVQTEYDAFLQQHRDTIGSKAQATQIGNLATALGECLGKLK